jgi:hypothetical protein
MSPVGQHDGPWPFAGVDEVGNRQKHVDGVGELVGPRLSGRRRPLGERGPVLWRRFLDGPVRPGDVEGVDAGEDLTDLEREGPRHRLFGQLVSLDPPPVHQHLGIGADRFRHRDAGCERGLLESEHVVVVERPVTNDVERLHSERSSACVESVHAVGGFALHPCHRSQRCAQMIEVHRTTLTRYPAQRLD